jgi:hypothetical protein
MKKQLLGLLFLILMASCAAPAQEWPESPLTLATFTENEVSVEIRLERLPDGSEDTLVATFSPVNPNCHLYGKDVPREGVGGLGRPTLLELVPGSSIHAAGSLQESALPFQSSEKEGLTEYPAGPVSLSLPITLPEGEEWFNEQVSVTYMACSGGSCLPPVIGKIIPVRIPGRDLP